MDDAAIAELLRNVIARPDDFEVLRVYADALIERGDPRGELIVVQLFADESDELATREHDLITQLDRSLAAELGQPNAAFEWRRGFVDVVDFSPSTQKTQLADAIRKLGVLPQMRKLRRIVVRFVEPGWGSLGPALVMLVKIASQLRALRELAFTMRPRGKGTPVHPIGFGELRPVLDVIPKLEVLEVGASDWTTLRGIKAPSLRRLVFEHTGNADLHSLASMQIPNLEELELRNGTFGAQYLDWLLGRDALRLRTLVVEVASVDMMRVLANRLPSSLVFSAVTTFTLRGAMDAACVGALVANADRLRKLRSFQVDALPGPLRQQLVRAVPNTVC